MRQTGTVKSVSQRYAVVEVQRMSACSGCHKADPGMGTAGMTACHDCSMFPQDSVLTVTAQNAVGAFVGDRVELETATQTVLGYAAAVFLLPLLLAVLGGVLGRFIYDAVWTPYVGASVGFILAFVMIRLILERTAKQKMTYTVVKILPRQSV